jgi:hypothetical protein
MTQVGTFGAVLVSLTGLDTRASPRPAADTYVGISAGFRVSVLRIGVGRPATRASQLSHRRCRREGRPREVWPSDAAANEKLRRRCRAEGVRRPPPLHRRLRRHQGDEAGPAAARPHRAAAGRAAEAPVVLGNRRHRGTRHHAPVGGDEDATRARCAAVQTGGRHPRRPARYHRVVVDARRRRRRLRLPQCPASPRDRKRMANRRSDPHCGRCPKARWALLCAGWDIRAIRTSRMASGRPSRPWQMPHACSTRTSSKPRLHTPTEIKSGPSTTARHTTPIEPAWRSGGLTSSTGCALQAMSLH